MIRRSHAMRFLGGFYAFPGGKVDDGDAAQESPDRCRGLPPGDSQTMGRIWDGFPAVAYWVAAIRELFEETGILMACDSGGEPVTIASGSVAEIVQGWRRALLARKVGLTTLLAEAGWFYDLRPLLYLSHFITPTSSPIRYSARFFLAALPPGQAPRLFLEETSEGFWIGPREGYRRFQNGELPMAEPAEYALGYLAHFDDYDALWQAHPDGQPRFHGIVDRIEFYGEGYDWTTGTWKFNKPPWHPLPGPGTNPISNDEQSLANFERMAE
jgi:8-oxo-dGTP pyrophosphatase MutT (NUDIX family)